MGFSYDFDPSSVNLGDKDASFSHRYHRIEKMNDESWYFSDNEARTFTAYLSVHSAGAPRDPSQHLAFSAMNNLLVESPRRILGGNMGVGAAVGPQELELDDRRTDAQHNIRRICADAGIRPSQLRILRPRASDHESHPLAPLNIDELGLDSTDGPVYVPVVSDFIYTYNPDVALAATPGDCPILLATAETPNGTIYMLVHYPWRGVSQGYVEQTDACLTLLGVERSTLRMYLSPGAHAESFPYERALDPRLEFPRTPALFQNIRSVNRDNEIKWQFGIDTPYFVHSKLLSLPGIHSRSLYTDTSDTGLRRSGYSSHNRACNEDPFNNTRDLLFVVSSSSAVQ